MCKSISLWSERKIAVMKIRAKILDAARSWFKRNGFVEVQGPVLIPALGEWPNYFEVKYFGKKAYLARGLQPYAETIVASLGKIYTITPVFRAEKARTQRHLTEYWQIEAEIPRCDLDGLIEIEEQLVSHVCQNLSKEAQEELERVQRDTEELKKFQPPFPRFTYDDAIKTLQKDGFGIQ
jgi:asparaginyl-tRNA synthetase